MAELQQAEVKVVTAGITKFGFGQINNPTPLWITWVFRVILYGVAVITLLANLITEIPVDLRNTINHYGVEIVAAAHAISRLFGVDISQYEPPKINQ